MAIHTPRTMRNRPRRVCCSNVTPTGPPRRHTSSADMPMTSAKSGDATLLKFAVMNCTAHGAFGTKGAACAMSIATIANPRSASGTRRRPMPETRRARLYILGGGVLAGSMPRGILGGPRRQ